ncbi:F-box protein At2g32560-like isoform X2 [Salvia miltiorrhiza]|uniref:F-box protein At2g32560-like isoform X2 n=1 Tax=Salvia miltiorrhiza TaxID=226208 RepID=UPI0025AD4924|nr:F-box protein At2g32560-like isoform X2 [Salvia miltiorrhiza]
MSPKTKVSAALPAPEMSVLDLPELVLECILEKLPAEGLCRMASVCTSLRDGCGSDHLWRKHMESKWGRIIGAAANSEWECYIASRKGLNQAKHKGLMGYLLALIRSAWSGGAGRRTTSSAVDSVMSKYLALESGDFWFPAQVYNRENGHVGFMLSCYDAMVSYDRRSESFNARYPAHGARASATESGVTWERLRAPLVPTSPHHLHISDCLHDLHPGHHIEIQWRRNKDFPYGWWYGVVGHLETCDGNANYCRCHNSAMVLCRDGGAGVPAVHGGIALEAKIHHQEGP